MSLSQHGEDCPCMLCEDERTLGDIAQENFTRAKTKALEILKEHSGSCLDNDQEVNEIAEAIALEFFQ